MGSVLLNPTVLFFTVPRKHTRPHPNLTGSIAAQSITILRAYPLTLGFPDGEVEVLSRDEFFFSKSVQNLFVNILQGNLGFLSGSFQA